MNNPKLADITLLDIFAAAALVGLYIQHPQVGGKAVSRECYAQAKAMLEARENVNADV